MVTVIDPSGTPVPVYNRGGMTIAEMNASQSSPAPQISAVASHTIVVLTTLSNSVNLVQMPSGCDIGDLVEFYVRDETGAEGAANLYPAAGESILGQSGGGFSTAGDGTVLRKITATQWRRLSYSAA